MNGTKIQKFESTKFRYCPIVSYAIINFNRAIEMAKEIDFENADFENADFRKFEGSVTLTLTLDDLESHIVGFLSSTSIHISMVHMAPLSLIVNGQTDGRTNIFPPMSTGHLC